MIFSTLGQYVFWFVLTFSASYATAGTATMNEELQQLLLDNVRQHFLFKL